MTFEDWYKPEFAVTEDEYERLCICWKAACSAQRPPLSDEQIDAVLDAARVGELQEGWTNTEYEIARTIEHDRAAAWGVTLATFLNTGEKK